MGNRLKPSVRKSVRMRNKLFESSINQSNYISNLESRERRATLLEDEIPFVKAVNRLTNWQRSQWAKAGYPGLETKDDVTKVEPFTKLNKV